MREEGGNCEGGRRGLTLLLVSDFPDKVNEG